MAIGPVKQVYLDRVKAAQQARSEASTTIEEGKQAAKQVRRRRFRQRIQVPKLAPPSTIHPPKPQRGSMHPWDARRAPRLGFGNEMVRRGERGGPKKRTLEGAKGFQREFDRKAGFHGAQLVGEGRTEPRQQKRMGLGRTGLGQFGTAMERFSKIGRATRRVSADQMQFEQGRGIIRGPTQAQKIQSNINALKKEWARDITGEGVGDVRGPGQARDPRSARERIFGGMGPSATDKQAEAYGQLSMRARQGYMPPRMGPIRISDSPAGRRAAASARSRTEYKNWENWRVQQQREARRAFGAAGVPPSPGSNRQVTPKPPSLDRRGMVREESYAHGGAKLRQQMGEGRPGGLGLDWRKAGELGINYEREAKKEAVSFERESGDLWQASRRAKSNQQSYQAFSRRTRRMGRHDPMKIKSSQYVVGRSARNTARNFRRQAIDQRRMAKSAWWQAQGIRQSLKPTMSTQLFD